MPDQTAAESWAYQTVDSVNMHRHPPGTTETDAYRDAQHRANRTRRTVIVYTRPGADIGLPFGPEWERHGRVEPEPKGQAVTFQPKTAKALPPGAQVETFFAVITKDGPDRWANRLGDPLALAVITRKDN